MTKLLCLAEITGAHGVRGLVKMQVFTGNPKDIERYSPLLDEEGKPSFHITLEHSVKSQWVAQIKEVANREQAAALRGTRLYAKRNQLPPPEKNTYYQADLVGLKAVQENKIIGTVVAVHDFGAGAMLEIALEQEPNRTEMLPFTTRHVPLVDIHSQKLVITPPVGWLENPTKDENTEGVP